MRRLLIFLKYPTPGQVKTRLAASVGDDAACETYRACAELTLERLSAFRGEATVCIDPPEALGQARAWLGPDWPLRAQQGATLGERLAEATADAFARGAQRVAVIGTDSPWIGANEIEEAFAALARAEVVLGPAQDGGYYLIGLSRAAPEIFDGIAWSTSSVSAETLAKAAALRLRVHLLRLGYDIDRVEDLERFLSHNPQSKIYNPKSKICSHPLRGGGTHA